MWVFPKIGVPQNGWFIMENPVKNLLIWMIWGYHYFLQHPYSSYVLYKVGQALRVFPSNLTLPFRLWLWPNGSWGRFCRQKTLSWAQPGVIGFDDGCTLDIQNPPVIPGEDRYLEPLKAFKTEMFGGSNTSSTGGPGCLGYSIYIQIMDTHAPHPPKQLTIFVPISLQFNMEPPNWWF